MRIFALSVYLDEGMSKGKSLHKRVGPSSHREVLQYIIIYEGVYRPGRIREAHVNVNRKHCMAKNAGSGESKATLDAINAGAN